MTGDQVAMGGVIAASYGPVCRATSARECISGARGFQSKVSYVTASMGTRLSVGVDMS
ncbi:hypothetical protein J2X03_000774 [Microbacterium trichothecenolyticum]|uniref:hypothetical protein n=1 Tax=Microbacterium trichothecenolyticum TaxID=69370 RepID=UPI002854F523|nr:hypothetical protein [Microbacterium trichothecenolyticum]MDR7110918.1 hypothetical protein [Microbacterium trichothecenolyticum]